VAAFGDATVPRKLGPFKVGRKLGAGGMATVFAARREGAQKGDLVALKVLAPNIAQDEAERGNFMREAAIATRLDHPNIVTTYEIGEYDGLMVLSMELVHGVPLGTLQKASRASAPLDIALRIVCDVARALQSAHELVDEKRGPLGLVHQDVSPHNIMIGYDGVTKLVDFGVARLAMLEGSRTESLKGKPSYASPEQINGKNIDRRTDVFALGVVMWELLTGERLFRRETSAATYLAVLHDPIPDVRARAPNVPEEVANVVARALNRDREARYPTAEALRVAIDEARGERIPEASQEELAFWIAQLVPPKLTFPELQAELEATFPQSANQPVVPDLTTTKPSAPAVLPPDAIVPDLDVPAKRSPPAAPVKADDELAAKPTVMPPQSSRSPAAPPSHPRPGAVTTERGLGGATPLSSRQPQPMTVDTSVDDFDMEIEREGALAQMSSMGNYQAAQRTRGPIASTASGLEVAHRRQMASQRGPLEDDEPSTKMKIAANVGALVLFGGAIAGLVKLAHRSGGLSLTSVLPHAFDGTSVVHAGSLAGTLLVLAIVLGFIGFRLRPRSWAFVVSGGAMLLASLAMVTVTLVSTETNETPPDGALLIPYVVPFGLLALAIGLAWRARARLAAVPLAALAGALAFLAFELSKLASAL